MSNFNLPENCPLAKYVDRERGGFMVLKGILLGDAARICQECTGIDGCEPTIQREKGGEITLLTLDNAINSF